MSDNHNNIEDKGWEQMELLLDQEMPQEKKHRKWMFLWLFFGILLIGLLAYSKLAEDSIIPESESIIAQTEKITKIEIEHNTKALTTEEEAQSGVTANIKNEKETSISHSNLNEVISNENKNVSGSPLPEIMNSRGNNSRTISNLNYSNENSSNVSSENLLIPSHTPETEVSFQKVNTSSSLSHDGIMADHSSQLLAQLSSITISELSLYPFDIGPLQMISVERIEEENTKLGGRFSFGALGSRVLGTSIGQYGGQLGYDFRARDTWGLRVTGSYLYGRYSEIMTTGVPEIFSDNMDDPSGEPEMDTNGTAVSNESFRINSTLHSARISLTPYVQVNRKLYVMAGLISSYNHINTPPIVNENVRAGAVFQGFQGDQFNLGGTMGVELLLSDQLSFGISYDRYISDIIPSSQDDLNIGISPVMNSRSRLNVGLRYGL